LLLSPPLPHFLLLHLLQLLRPPLLHPLLLLLLKRVCCLPRHAQRVPCQLPSGPKLLQSSPVVGQLHTLTRKR
jgi:hypothetical protein